MTQVLFATESESDPFNFPADGAGKILLDGHQGGTWTLQIQSPLGNWLDTDITFSENGGSPDIIPFRLSYRLTGGTVGAQAWIW